MKLIHKKSGILFAGILFSIITGILIWGRYEIYREQLAISVAYTEVQDENQGAVLLKKKPELTEEEVEDYLVSHGFESITTTIYGKAFLKESFFIVFLESVLALGAVGWIAWEKKKTEDSCIKKLEQIGQELDCMCQGREWTENRGWEEEGVFVGARIYEQSLEDCFSDSRSGISRKRRNESFGYGYFSSVKNSGSRIKIDI